MRAARLVRFLLAAMALRPDPAAGREPTYWQAVRAIDRELAGTYAREDLVISLDAIGRGSRVSRALEDVHYVERIGRSYRFTRSALRTSRPCDDAPHCRVFPFGRSVRAGRPLLAALFSRATTFNEPVWTYWFSYVVVPVTALAMRAAREGLVDTISVADARCPVVWSPAVPLVANASVGPDLPFQIEIKSPLYLHGAVARPKSKTTLTCDYAAMELQIEQTR